MAGYRTLTMNQAEDWLRYGRMSERDFRQYRLEWEWTAFRHTPWHKSAYRALGRELYWKRINRARKRCGFPEYDLSIILKVS